MNKILIFLYVISTVMVMLGFYAINFLTEPLGADGYAGGNGNPGLFPVVFVMPFFFYFLYGTVELSMRLAERYREKRILFVSVAISVLTAISIAVYTYLEADAVRTEILLKRDDLKTASEIPLLNPFSNSIFFNPLTFVLVVLVCYVIGALWSVSRARRKQKLTLQKPESTFIE
ncbi:hypothetical protein [Metaplanococcus flavidus]|uniref:DUF4199 domain-containing protein n=1 Tax=Metaplanococcus flavidus TaxID=569883 RepID=A0ABW3LDE1_9BACL